MTASNRRNSILLGLVGMVLLMGAVQVLALWGPQQWQVPTLAGLWESVTELAASPNFTAAVLQTLGTVAMAIGFALVAGVAIGVVLGLSAPAYRAFLLPLELVRPIPAIAVIPLAILALGQGQVMTIAVAGLACWWPILFNTMHGVQNVEPVAVQTARTFGLTRWKVVLRVVLPGTLPAVFTGLKVAGPLALIVTVGAEYLATAGEGLGGVLITATSSGDLQVLWASAVVTGIMGLAIGGLTSGAAALACPWART